MIHRSQVSSFFSFFNFYSHLIRANLPSSCDAALFAFRRPVFDALPHAGIQTAIVLSLAKWLLDIRCHPVPPSACLSVQRVAACVHIFLSFSFFLSHSLTDSPDGGFNRTANCLCHQALAVQLDSPLTKITLPFFFFFFFSSHLYPAPTTSKRRKKKKKAQCGGPR